MQLDYSAALLEVSSFDDSLTAQECLRYGVSFSTCIVHLWHAQPISLKY